MGGGHWLARLPRHPGNPSRTRWGSATATSDCWPNKSCSTGSDCIRAISFGWAPRLSGLPGALTKEPDRVGTAAILGPRVLISTDALASTGLISPGAMVRYQVRLTAPDPAAIARDIRIAFPGQGWRIRDPSDAAPGVSRFIDQTALFLTLVGLTSLLVGGIGVANGVRAWLDARARTIATLRCLGASAGLVFAVCLIQVLALAAGGIVLGVAAGAALPLVGARFLTAILPVPPVLGIYPGPLLLAATYGLLIALCFALWPLGRAARIPGGALFREGLVPEATRPSAALIAVNAALALALVGLTVATAADRFFAIVFLCRRRVDPGAVPRRRVGGDAARPVGAGVAVAVGAPWGRQPASSWRPDAAAAAVGRPGTVDARGRGADPGQHAASDSRSRFPRTRPASSSSISRTTSFRASKPSSTPSPA